MQDFATLKTIVARNLEYHPDKIALIEGERQLTFRQFADRTRSMGNALLALGLKKGDRVAILSQNSIENAETYFSIPNAGLVLVMLNFRLASPEILTILKDAHVSALMVNERFMAPIEAIRDKLSFVDHFIYIGDRGKTPGGWHHYESMIENASSDIPPATVEEQDLAALMYTSGTTGSPKGCMGTHGNFYHIGRSLTLEMKTDETDVGIVASPLFHATGEVVLMNCMYSGTTAVIMPAWDAEEFMRLVQAHRVSTGMIATPMLLFLVQHPRNRDYDLSSLKKLFFAGAPVTPVVFQQAIALFGNVFLHLFGTSETVGQITILRREDITRALEQGKSEILASCGKSFTDMQAEVVDEFGVPVAPGEVGEIRARGLGVTMGYWNKPEETAKVFRNGWYYPLDLCRMDADGFIYVVDRKKDMIITGGENVYPAEVENVLYEHPVVAQAAVIGTPDEKWGEAVTAFIVKKKEMTATAEEIMRFCKQRIAGYKTPKKILFVDALPMSVSGKILKYKLRETASL